MEGVLQFLGQRVGLNGLAVCQKGLLLLLLLLLLLVVLLRVVRGRLRVVRGWLRVVLRVRARVRHLRRVIRPLLLLLRRTPRWGLRRGGTARGHGRIIGCVSPCAVGGRRWRARGRAIARCRLLLLR